MTVIAGLKIYYTENALEVTTERLFPKSKNRSKRIHKKLVKRFGGEFRKRPAMWRVGNELYAHPSYREMIQNSLTMKANAAGIGFEFAA